MEFVEGIYVVKIIWDWDDWYNYEFEDWMIDE